MYTRRLLALFSVHMHHKYTPVDVGVEEHGGVLGQLRQMHHFGLELRALRLVHPHVGQSGGQRTQNTHRRKTCRRRLAAFGAAQRHAVVVQMLLALGFPLQLKRCLARNEKF